MSVSGPIKPSDLLSPFDNGRNATTGGEIPEQTICINSNVGRVFLRARGVLAKYATQLRDIVMDLPTQDRVTFTSPLRLGKNDLITQRFQSTGTVRLSPCLEGTRFKLINASGGSIIVVAFDDSSGTSTLRTLIPDEVATFQRTIGFISGAIPKWTVMGTNRPTVEEVQSLSPTLTAKQAVAVNPPAADPAADTVQEYLDHLSITKAGTSNSVFPTGGVLLNGGASPVNLGDISLIGLDADLTTIAGLTATTDNFLQSKSSQWSSRTVAQVKNDLGLTGTNSGDQTISSLGGAPNSESFVVLALSENLSNERVATTGNHITITDAGAGGAATFEWRFNPRKRISYYSDFSTNLQFGTSVSGTGATAVLTVAYGDADHSGFSELSLGTTTTGRAGLVLSENTQAFLFGTNPNQLLACLFLQTLSSATETYTAWVGFNDAATGNGVDMVSFRYTHAVNSGRWEAVCRSNSTETVADTGITADTGFHMFEISVNATGTSVRFTIDNTTVATITANIPTGSSRTTGLFVGGVKSAGSTNRKIVVDMINIEIDVNR